ncbi:MAG: hypothetical protein LWY06_05110 [Firmicutes bacterium]|nr:hypothetical protein [Bacillota bacterium]
MNTDNQPVKGLAERRCRNGFYVAQLHYTAEPGRDPSTPQGLVWYENARRGMPEASWRKEYEIDWFARSGQLVYPLFRRDVHVVEPFAIPSHWTRYMSVDPGLRNPTAVLWAAVDNENSLFFYDEYYVPEKLIADHCRAIKAKEMGIYISRRLIDPSASNRSIVNGASARDEYAAKGIVCSPAKNDLEVGIDRVGRYLSIDPVSGKPGAFFFSCLVNTINEISNYRWEELEPGGEEKRDLPEKPVKRQDHLMDCMRYIIMDEPRYSAKTVVPGYKPHSRWEGMTTGY